MMYTTDKSYYAVLGVSHDASQDEIERAYRQRAKEFHPDRNKHPDAHAQMANLNEAYAVLSDPIKRAEYNYRFADCGPTPRPKFRRAPIFTGNSLRYIIPFVTAFVVMIVIGMACLTSILPIIRQAIGKLQDPPPVIKQIATPTGELGTVYQPTEQPLVNSNGSNNDKSRRGNVSYPTQCRNSLLTRFQPNQNGQTDSEYKIKLRDHPRDVDGTSLVPNTRFVTIGEPVCASPASNRNLELLWWPVRLTSGTARGREGWIAESGLNANGRMYYNIHPIN